jgi:hypothetical protein
MATGDKWRVAARDEEVWLVRRRNGGSASTSLRGSEVIGATAAAARVSSWFPVGWGADDRLAAEICVALEGAFSARDAPESGSLHTTLRRALEDGRLVAIRAPHPAPVEGFAPEEEAEPPTPRREVREETTWVRIVLVDDSDPPQPVPFKRYVIELPDGSVREGRLDANGAAALTGIDPGVCEVSFPDFDARDWRHL